MKRTVLIVLLLILAVPAWSATRPITVDQLKQLLISLQKDKKNDEQTATELKQVELTEELTGAAIQGLGSLVPGPRSTEQVFVLQARSSMLPPPAAEIPADPALDAAAQKALLAKAEEYVSKTYSQLPHLTATRMIARFQDGAEAIHSYSGMNHGTAQKSDPLWEETSQYIRLMSTSTNAYESQNGEEKISPVKDQTNWGVNNMISPTTPPVALPTILKEAAASGAPHFVRWERINDRKAAVFAFAIDRKKTKFGVNYCCFPVSDTAGMLSSGMGISQGGANGGTGTLQTVSEWKPFKTNTGYHGEIFIDAELGVVLRTVTVGEFKKTDFVHAESVRTDFGAASIGGKTLVVPMHIFTVAEIVPNGDSFVAHYSIRHMFVTQTFQDYKLAQ